MIPWMSSPQPIHYTNSNPKWEGKFITGGYCFFLIDVALKNNNHETEA
jgi:hypothetical protein